MILVIVFNGTDIVDDGLEFLLAEWTLCLYLGPLHKTAETKLMKATVRETLIFQLPQTYGTVWFW
jgi:hypothetical protein